MSLAAWYAAAASPVKFMGESVARVSPPRSVAGSFTSDFEQELNASTAMRRRTGAYGNLPWIEDIIKAFQILINLFCGIIKRNLALATKPGKPSKRACHPL